MPATANDTRDKVRHLQNTLYLAAKRSPNRRFHALYDKVHRIDVLERAWQQVRANQGSPGIDAQTIEAIEAGGVETFLAAVQTELREERYRPQAVRRVWIPKPGKPEKRPLGIASVRDRVVQTAAKLVLEAIFEADFRNCSYGFRPKRSAHQARERIRKAITAEQCRWVLDADIRSFFDSVNWQILGVLLRRRISDRRMLRLLEAWQRAGVLDGTVLVHTTVGTAQGAAISPLMANVYLSVLDRIWEDRFSRLGKLVRYADDLVILTWQRWQAERAWKLLSSILARLKLELATNKTRMVGLEDPTKGFDFLGYHYRWLSTRRGRSTHFTACWPSQKAMQAARDRVRELTPLQRIGLPISMVVQDLNRFLDGWAAYYRHGNSTEQLDSLDWYVHNRVCRFISRKCGRRRGIGRGLAVMLESTTRLGLHRLGGTVAYDSARATR
jgi:group II intron reverse transcriptase/maturase